MQSSETKSLGLSILTTNNYVNLQKIYLEQNKVVLDIQLKPHSTMIKTQVTVFGVRIDGIQKYIYAFAAQGECASYRFSLIQYFLRGLYGYFNVKLWFVVCKISII